MGRQRKETLYVCKAERISTVAVADGYYVVREKRQKIRILNESLELGIRMG
jgi:hypothetical protein